MENRKKVIDKILPVTKYGCHFRLVEKQDAQFIHELRTDTKLSRFISKTSPNKDDQLKWIEDYKIREKNGDEFYIIAINSISNIKLGLNRIYNLTQNDFEIGSWLYSPKAEQQMAIIGDLFVRSIAFEAFGYKTCKFEVRKGNKSVLRYHYLFNPTVRSEDNLNLYFELDYESFVELRNKLLKLFGYE